MAKKKYKYAPTQEAKDLHRRCYVNGGWVGVGGDITITPPPPKESYVIKEATQDEYKVLFEERGLENLIEKIEVSEGKTQDDTKDE